jgi:hypothetical protein
MVVLIWYSVMVRKCVATTFDATKGTLFVLLRIEVSAEGSRMRRSTSLKRPMVARKLHC